MRWCLSSRKFGLEKMTAREGQEDKLCFASEAGLQGYFKPDQASERQTVMQELNRISSNTLPTAAGYGGCATEFIRARAVRAVARGRSAWNEFLIRRILRMDHGHLVYREVGRV
jgi:hypothetical protein